MPAEHRQAAVSDARGQAPESMAVTNAVTTSRVVEREPEARTAPIIVYALADVNWIPGDGRSRN
jgi:hypothetical protein